MITAPAGKRKGDVVEFMLRDVHHPAPDVIVHELHDGDRLKGRLLGFCEVESVAGSPFAIVRVPHLREKCLVSVSCLLSRKGASAEP
ncbi:MAG TPA: hypothetical protein VH138_11565 [Vicinamibacterales bacterium]|nr:hypothetical protein [Vicinamibacterales bacterium]